MKLFIIFIILSLFSCAPQKEYYIEDNVAFHTKGHTYFIEDAAETRNKLIHNLAIRSDASNSLLNTDSTPSSFWITHPNNDFINNHAAGAKRYGFWYDL